MTLSVSPGSLSVAEAQTIIDAAAKPAQAAGLEVETGGQLGQKVSKPSTESSELIGIIAAMVILTFTFGTVVSMLLPIITAIFGLASTLAIIRILGHVMTVSDGRADARDDDRARGRDRLRPVHRHAPFPRAATTGCELRESIARAAATSGGAVFFAGGTVTIALVSLAVAEHPAGDDDGADGRDRGGRRGARGADAAARRCSRSSGRTSTRCGFATAIPGAGPAASRACGPGGRTRSPAGPVIAGLAALAILIPLMIPLLSLKLGQQDIAALSTSTTARRAYDLIAKNFGQGVNGPLMIAVTLGSPAQAGRSDSRPARPSQKDVPHVGVAASTPIQIDKAGTTAYFNAIAKTGPADQATADLVAKLRSSVIPEAEKGTNMRAYVGGTTAGYVDLAVEHLEQAPAADRGRDRAQLHAADRWPSGRSWSRPRRR